MLELEPEDGNGTIEIVSGLNEGEQVILDVSGLTRGLPVTIIE